MYQKDNQWTQGPASLPPPSPTSPERDEIKSTREGSVPVPEGLIYFLFFLSGFSALIYELAWLNRLQLIMGHTIYALSTTLSAFLSGLGVGALAAKIIISRKKNTLFFYLIMEFAIGFYGILFFPLLQLVTHIYSPLVKHFQFSLVTLGLIQFFFCGLLIFIPTVMMGATLPCLAHYLYKKGNDLPQKIGRLYGINTLGAALGCATTGLVLLPSLGYTKSIYFATGINFILFALALALIPQFKIPTWSLSSGYGQAENGPTDEMGQTLSTSNWNFHLQEKDKFLFAVLFLSGMASVMVQFLWNRLGALNFGPSAYIFPMVTTLILLSMAGGSLLLRRFSEKKETLQTLLLITPLVAGISLLFGDYFYSRLALMVFEWHQKINPGHGLYLVLQFLTTFLLLFPCMTAMGVIFPMAISCLTWKRKNASELLGLGYAINIGGIILGSLLGSFLIIPYLGIENLEKTLFFLLILSSFLVSLYLRRNFLLPLSLSLFFLVAVIIVPPFDKILLTSGLFYNREPYTTESDLNNMGFTNFDSYLHFFRQNLLAYKDDSHATVSIHQSKSNPKSVWFKVNGKIDGNAVGDSSTVKLLSLFPLLLGTDYKDVLVVGLGTGLTADMTAFYPYLRKTDVVEISEGMIDFSRTHFGNLGPSLWFDKRFNVFHRDGREYLQNSDKKYDLIISEPSNPWVEGVASLFTQEYFEVVKSHLTPKGVASIWFHSYGLECNTIESVFLALERVFPSFFIFKNGRDLFILASQRENVTRLNKIPAEYEYLEAELFNALGIARKTSDPQILDTDLVNWLNTSLGEEIGNPASKDLIADTAIAMAEKSNLAKESKLSKGKKGRAKDKEKMDPEKVNKMIWEQNYKNLAYAHFVTDHRGISKFKNGGVVNTDDNQFLQYQSGKTFWRNIHCDMKYFSANASRDR